MLKFVKASLAFTWFSIFVFIMRKYLLGILLIFVFLQPVASRALVYFNAHNISSNTEHGLITKSPTQHTATPMEALATEEDDEDEQVNTETKNNECNLILENQINANLLFQTATKIASYNHSALNRPGNQPLYILWSVFRI
ncbi:MAG: hypothetical protein RL377_1515 [Bacteroidota bacterium]